MCNTERACQSAGHHLGRAAKVAADVVDMLGAGAPPAVSVVVPSYNHGRFVRELLPALTEQCGAPFELVLVDDGSTDDAFGASVAQARSLGLRGKLIRLHQNQGRSTARNVGIWHAAAPIIAFIDSDCLPAAGWLAAGLRALAAAPAAGSVQGRTLPRPGQRRPLFSHYIEITRFDGTFSTCNVFYRRDALLAVGGFDPSVTYWEDVDLGWRVRRAGWVGTFAEDAVVHHQVLPLTARQWLNWPRHFAYMPAKTARYPEFRRFLFLGLWVHWFHALFDLALLGLLLGALLRRPLLLLAVPYLLAFPLHHGVTGRWPPLKAAAHLAWDATSFVVLLRSSARHRSLVL